MLPQESPKVSILDKISKIFKKYQNFPKIHFEDIQIIRSLPTAQTLDFLPKIKSFWHQILDILNYFGAYCMFVAALESLRVSNFHKNSRNFQKTSKLIQNTFRSYSNHWKPFNGSDIEFSIQNWARLTSNLMHFKLICGFPHV